MMPRLPIVFSFARSGGTLVNQLLGSYPGCLVLSEVNPSASVVSPAEQGFRWLSLVKADEVAAMDRLGYARTLMELYARATDADATLLVRDWVTVNFLPETAGDTVQPSGILEQANYAGRAGFEMLPLLITRRADAVFESMKRCFSHLATLTDSGFGEAYVAYARAVKDFPSIQLESLRDTPLASTRMLLEMLEMLPSHAESMVENFHSFRQCTGNTTLKSPCASAEAQGILPLAQEHLIEGLSEGALVLFEEADRLLGYE